MVLPFVLAMISYATFAAAVIAVIVVLDVALLMALAEMAYQRRLVAWCDEREALTKAVFTELYVVTSIPNHTGMTTEGDMVRYQGTPLNFATLKDMTTVMLAQEEDRRTAVRHLKEAMGDLTAWELDHPLPKAPPTLWRLLPSP